MRIGVTVPMSFSDRSGRMPSWTEVRAFARHAEAIGLDSIWVCDHFLSAPPGQPPEGIHEGWTILSALAAATHRVELGQLVMCVSFRNPGLLAKMATTADSVSGGRLILGLGAGWYDAEYSAFGYPMDHRVSRFEEALQIIKQLLGGSTVSYAGRYYELRDAVLLPPSDRPIPVLVAGSGPRMLRLAARYAEAWNTAWFRFPDDLLRRTLADLAAAIASEGREEDMRRTVGVEFDSSEPVDEIARAIGAYDELGIDDLIVRIGPMGESALDHLADALHAR